MLGLVYAISGLLCAAAPRLGPAAGQVLTMQAGTLPTADGLELAVPDRVPAIETRGGRTCWRTDLKANRQYLHFQADPGFWREGGGPVRVTVTYYDEGTDGFAVKYWSNSRSVGRDAPSTPEHYKSDSLDWRQHTFLIPDAALDPQRPFVFWITSNSWLAGGAEDSIAGVELRMGGIVIGPPQTYCSADPNNAAELTVTAVPGPGFEVDIDNDDVALRADSGFVEATAHLDDGQALVYFVPPGEPGFAKVTAKLGEFESVSDLTILPGTGPIKTMWAPYLAFLEYDPQRVSGVETQVAAKVELTPDADAGPQGPSLRIDYRYENPQNGSARAVVPLALDLPGVPVGLRMVVKCDDAANSLWLIFSDSTGQGFYYPMGNPQRTDWSIYHPAITDITRHSGGADDGRFHAPLQVRELRMLNATSRAKADHGTFHLAWVRFQCAASESAWAAWREAHPEQPDPLEMLPPIEVP